MILSSKRLTNGTIPTHLSNYTHLEPAISTNAPSNSNNTVKTGTQKSGNPPQREHDFDRIEIIQRMGIINHINPSWS